MWKGMKVIDADATCMNPNIYGIDMSNLSSAIESPRSLSWTVSLWL